MSDWSVHKINFDEEWYLAQNRDVAEAVKSGGLPSALHHYVNHGFAEGRLAVPPRREQVGAVDAGAVNTANGTSPAPQSRITTPESPRHTGISYLIPTDLTQSPLPLRRVAMIGSCFMRDWGFEANNPSNCPVDFFLVNNASQLPPRSREDIEQYDFQIIQIPLRAIMHDGLIWRLAYANYAGYESAFKTACQRLELQLRLWMKYNIEYSLLTFVTNFFLPQENSVGRLLPRYDLRNPAYFIHKLNEFVEHQIAQYRNVYLLDTDKIAASFGRRYVQDDGIAMTTHGGLFPLSDPVDTRMDPLAAMSTYYEITWPGYYREAVWNEITAMLRTIRQLDMVKLVVVDLDDTLWNGVSGDMDEISPFMVEGWPLGLVEALLYLKQRGVLLGIVSKNDETRIRQIWDDIFVGRLLLDDFAAIRINWRPKNDNMKEIIETVNITARSVVFIDDNPAERAAMQHAFPEMRIIGQNPYVLRRILLWAPETQVSSITDESGRRTEMMQAQFAREDHRSTVSRDEFLASAAPKVTMIAITSTSHPRFSRVLELINKTNQFNTTGRRWKLEELDGLLHGDGVVWAFEVRDAFTRYGLVGVVIVRGDTIEQWVMSCRVLGYEIENAVMAHLAAGQRKAGHDGIKGLLIETEANHPCRDLFEKCGFLPRKNHWLLPAQTIFEVPSHVTISLG
ncbi:MAG TPA: HAD-IIIC family phosphatase [Stellaceae bacterium]|jgi:FkbH-like protein|nr:HAD-IIIC family phosphatase [Stellaceae bacterium]